MSHPTLTTGDLHRLIVDSVEHIALFFADEAGAIRTWSPGAARLHGYSADEAIGQPLALVYDGAVPGSAALHQQLDLKRKDGKMFLADVSITPVPGGGFACMTADASGRRRLEQAAAEATDELHQFAFVVSHDLKEPLRSVKSYSELLARRYKGRLEGDADEFIGFITGAADRMALLLNDLVSYSQAGRADRMRVERTDANAVLQWTLMNLQPALKEASADVTHDPLPAVEADQAQLAKIFEHLLNNALKFRSAGPPRVHIAAAPAGDGLWEFSVRDNGPGIDPQYHDRVFGVFKRLHGKDVPGTGIGLAVCRKVVAAHGGRIWLESTPGEGTTVRFTLPASE